MTSELHYNEREAIASGCIPQLHGLFKLRLDPIHKMDVTVELLRESVDRSELLMLHDLLGDSGSEDGIEYVLIVTFLSNFFKYSGKGSINVTKLFGHHPQRGVME